MTMDEEDLTVQNLYRANKVQQKRIRELEVENKQLSRDYYCVGTLCNSIDEFGKPIKEEQWTELGERIYEIMAGQLQRIKELDKLRSGVRVSLIAARSAVIKGGEVKEETLTKLIKELDV